MAKWTPQELFDLINGMTLVSVVAGKAFDYPAADCPLITIGRLLRYGGQRLPNDKTNPKMGKDAKPESKHEYASRFIATLVDGSWPDEARAPRVIVDETTDIRRKVTLAALGKDDRAALAKMADKGVGALDQAWIDNVDALQPEFDKELARRNAPKAKIALKGLGAIK